MVFAVHGWMDCKFRIAESSAGRAGEREVLGDVRSGMGVTLDHCARRPVDALAVMDIFNTFAA